MEHYFISKEHQKADYFQFSWKFLDKDFVFKSCDDVFSKDMVDYGTYVLLKTIVNKVEIKGNVLDIGCGYGPIGIVIARFFDNINITMTDINQTAVELIEKTNIEILVFSMQNIENFQLAAKGQNVGTICKKER